METRDFFTRQLEEFIDMDQSEEYKAAERLVKNYTAKLDLLKKVMKEQGITTAKVRSGTTVKRLRFNVKKMKRVNASAMPEEIRQQYMIETDVWWKNVDVFDMKEDMEAARKEEEEAFGDWADEANV
jgi:hypothetical protein